MLHIFYWCLVIWILLESQCCFLYWNSHFILSVVGGLVLYMSDTHVCLRRYCLHKFYTVYCWWDSSIITSVTCSCVVNIDILFYTVYCRWDCFIITSVTYSYVDTGYQENQEKVKMMMRSRMIINVLSTSGRAGKLPIWAGSLSHLGMVKFSCFKSFLILYILASKVGQGTRCCKLRILPCVDSQNPPPSLAGL